MVTEKQEQIVKIILNCAFAVHSELGAVLFENAYQKCLAYELKQAGLFIEVEKTLPLIYKGVEIDCSYRIDILVENQIIIENKSVIELSKLHLAQILNYIYEYCRYFTRFFV